MSSSTFKNSLLFYFHLGTFVAVSIGIQTFYEFYVNQGINGGHPLGMLTFLTFWGQLIHFFYFLNALIVDLFNLTGSNDGSLYYMLLKCRDLMFRSIAFPVGMIVFVMFWSIYHFDRELILPLELDRILPPYLNHLQHTLPGIVMIIEMASVNHQYHRFKIPLIDGVASTANLYQDIAQLLSFNLTYLSILVVARYYQGRWVYPIIEVIPLHSKIIFIFSSSCFFSAIYIISRQISRWIWGGETEFAAPKGVIKAKQQELKQQQQHNIDNSKKVN